MPRIMFKNIKVNDPFVSIKDKVKVGRKFRVVRKTEKPKKLVFLYCIDDRIELDFTMAELNECLIRG